MNGTGTDTVASSRIDALGGLSMCWILSTPPCFWAWAGIADADASTAMAANNARRRPLAFIVFPPGPFLLTLYAPPNFTPTVRQPSGVVQALRRGQRNRQRLDGGERRRIDSGAAGERHRRTDDRFDLHRPAEVVV